MALVASEDAEEEEEEEGGAEEEGEDEFEPDFGSVLAGLGGGGLAAEVGGFL